MIRVLLLQLDGKNPNLALMRLAAHHRAAGDSVELRQAPTVGAVERRLGDAFDKVYASAIFERSRPIADRLRRVYPDAIIGGSGVDELMKLEHVGVATRGPLDYGDYDARKYPFSIGFTQRGCRLKCSFCKVPRMEGRPRPEKTIAEIWRGEPFPRWIVLLDNDFFGVPDWYYVIDELRAGKYRVSFNQGINARMLTDEAAAAIASVDYRDDSFQVKKIYTAWDNLPDEDKLFRGMMSLVKYGVKPDHITVYVLVGYDHATRSAAPALAVADLYRHRKLREFGARPYPMPFVHTRQLVGFQRWVIGAYDKRVGWDDWERAGYSPRKLGLSSETPMLPGLA